MRMKHGSLFNGIGGFQLAAQWAGWENVFSSEIDPICNKITKKHFPNCIQHEDIRTTDFTIYRGAINVLSGGFPCQNISLAASRNRVGVDGEKSGLWREMLRATDEIKPDYVIVENSHTINKKGLTTILNSYSDIGYDAEWQRLQGNQFGVPQRRRRTYIILYTSSIGNRLQERQIFSRWNVAEYTDWRDTDARVYGVANGIPNRVDRHRALGNALIPLIPFAIFKSINQFHSSQEPLSA